MHDQEGSHFRDWLTSELRARRMSGRQLALRSGLAASTVSRVLRGDRRPRMGTAVRLAAVMGVENAARAAATLIEHAGAPRSDPSGLVERAIRSDGLLHEDDVRAAMAAYLTIRARRARALHRAGDSLKVS